MCTNREFLRDYAANEEAQRALHAKQERWWEREYPPRTRFEKLAPTFTYGDTLRNTPIWPQIPLTGSLVVVLRPSPESECFAVHGFDANLTEDLVKFSKETGRVQFILNHAAPLYEGLDYLEPIFRELRPPEAITRCPPDKAAVFRRAFEEFDAAARPFFLSGLLNHARQFGEEPRALVNQTMEAYCYLRAFGYDEIANKVLDNVIVDPTRAYALLELAGTFIVAPRANPFPANMAYNTAVLRRAKEKGIETPTRRMSFPSEIGSFLLGQTTYASSGLDATRDVIAHYEAHDYYRVFDALNDAVVKASPDRILEEKEHVREILEQTWNAGARLHGVAKGVQVGLGFTIGLLGPVLAGPPGLLATFGVAVDAAAGGLSEAASVAILKKTVPGRLATVFEFQRSYPTAQRKVGRSKVAPS